MTFNVIEPHPSVPRTSKKAHLSTGRGGAGNFSSHSASSLTAGPTATGPASKVDPKSPKTSTTTATSAKSSSKSKYSSGGIGGAGNFVPTSERRLFSFDEELERQQRMEAARASTPVYHFGRGGAGNLSATKPRGSASSQGSAASSAASTTSATSSEAAAARLGSRFGKMVRALSTSRE